MDKRFFLEWRISKQDQGKIIRDFFRENDISKTALTDIKFKGGGIFINGEEATVRYTLKEDDLLKAVFPKEEPGMGLQGEDMPLDILYEDDLLLIVNKPARISTIPSREHPGGSLANGLIGYYLQKGIQATTHIVTRLDRDTSGLVLAAKHRHVHHLLSIQQKAGKLNRTYEAFAHGTVVEDAGTIEEPIGRRKSSIIEREVHPNGQYACTSYTVLRRFPEFTHVQLNLMTGRTHQIRVHLSHIGHPLLGDDLYGGSRLRIKRQALHCRQLEFFHPFLKKKIMVRAPFPEDMSSLL